LNDGDALSILSKINSASGNVHVAIEMKAFNSIQDQRSWGFSLPTLIRKLSILSKINQLKFVFHCTQVLSFQFYPRSTISFSVFLTITLPKLSILSKINVGLVFELLPPSFEAFNSIQDQLRRQIGSGGNGKEDFQFYPRSTI